MRKWRLMIALLLCPSLSVYAMPIISIEHDETPEILKISDVEMGQLYGSGGIEVELNDYNVGGQAASGTIANRTTLTFNYEMQVMDQDGNVIEVFDSGAVQYGTVKLINGTPTLGNGSHNKFIRLRAWNAGIGGSEVYDSSWADVSIDEDGDGILNSIESSVPGMDPFDPADALLDFDEDGINNRDELTIHFTDPNNDDTDGDGIPDGEELLIGFDPTNSDDGLGDPDMDFVSTADELYVHGTDPYTANPGLVQDTDGDGVNDTLETRLGMNPQDSSITDVGGYSAQDKLDIHVLNRFTFGPDPDSVKAIADMGVGAWFADQLNAHTDITMSDDPAQVIRNQFAFRGASPERHGAVRPLHSSRQLQSRMALFWDNHFNTFKNISAGAHHELHEEDLFFVNALGNFRALLDASAKSQAMMTYLDLKNSSAPIPNENYAREVMELHTLGVTTDAGVYGPDDVAALSSILSGWTTKNLGTVSHYYYQPLNGTQSRPAIWEYEFDAGAHVTGSKEFMNTYFDGQGDPEQEGVEALDILAEHPQTAAFICEKLAKTFVSDSPDGVTLQSCESVFIATADAPDQIAQALTALFDSAEFQSSITQRGKFKDTQEYMFSLGRLVNARASANSTGFMNDFTFGERVEEAGQGLFNKAPPTGYKEAPSEWVTTNSALSRFREGMQLLYDGRPQVMDDIGAHFSDADMFTAGDVIRNVFKMMLAGEYDYDMMVMAYWELHPEGRPFDIASPEAHDRIKSLIGKLSQMPEFNLH